MIKDWSGFRFGSKGTGLWTGLDNNEDNESLHVRRERLALKFAKKCLNQKKISDMFPKNLNHSNINIRNKEIFHVNHANTERYRNSTIPFLQRKLNESKKIEGKRLKALLQVNCVSYVDPITS